MGERVEMPELETKVPYLFKRIGVVWSLWESVTVPALTYTEAAPVSHVGEPRPLTSGGSWAGSAVAPYYT